MELETNATLVVESPAVFVIAGQKIFNSDRCDNRPCEKVNLPGSYLNILNTINISCRVTIGSSADLSIFERFFKKFKYFSKAAEIWVTNSEKLTFSMCHRT